MDEKNGIRGVSPEDLKKLKEFFPEDSLEWLPKSVGKKNNGEYWAMVVPYITRVAVMDRLDEVCGPENWKDSYEQGPGGGVLCHLSIRINGEWITKCDGAENTQVESIKGGISDAFKRAASRWGVARYLAMLPRFYAYVHKDGKSTAKYKPNKGATEVFRYDPPRLPVEWVPTIVEGEVVLEIKKKIQDCLDKIGKENLAPKQNEYLDYKFKVGFTEGEARKVLSRLKSDLSKEKKEETEKPEEESGKYI